MKTLPTLPFVFSYSGTAYAAVSKNPANDKLTLVVLAGSGRGQIYADNLTVDNLLGDIARGTAKLEGQLPKETLDTSLKIEVDSSQLDKALATAKELEATVKRLAGGLK